MAEEVKNNSDKTEQPQEKVKTSRERVEKLRKKISLSEEKRIANANADEIPFAWKNPLVIEKGAKNSKVLKQLKYEENLRTKQQSKQLTRTDE